MTTASPTVDPSNQPQDSATLLDSIRQGVGITDEDLALLERVDRAEIDGRIWEVGKTVPVKATQLVLYIADEGDEVRAYSAPAQGVNEPFCRWRMRTDRGGIRRSFFSLELFQVLVGREMTDSIEAAAGAPEFEEALEYIKGLPPMTPASQIIADLEAGKHQEDDDGDGGDKGPAAG